MGGHSLTLQDEDTFSRGRELGTEGRSENDGAGASTHMAAAGKLAGFLVVLF